MDACLAASLLYFLVPNPVACPSDAAIVAQGDQDDTWSVFYAPKSARSSATPFSVLIHDKTKLATFQ
jgi:hypothetical protein